MTIDFDRIAEVALKGIRRAAIFLGLGVNAARNKELRDYDLADSPIKVLPQNVDPETITGFKTEFERWIVLSAFREASEHFAVFLDHVFGASLTMLSVKGKLTNDPAKEFKEFERVGIAGKLDRLGEIAIVTSKRQYLDSISQVRNCITHRRSVVSSRDLDENESLELDWWTLDILLTTPSGETLPLVPGFYAKGGNVRVKAAERKRSFRIGEALTIEAGDVQEMLLMYRIATTEIIRSALALASDLGITVTRCGEGCSAATDSGKAPADD